MSPVWVLMAWDGPRENAESWEPIAMFAGVEEPSMLRMTPAPPTHPWSA